MIHNVYIIRKSGECLVSRAYGSIALDEGLISGFLSALQSFVAEVSGDRIRSIKTGNVKFIYGGFGDVLFVFCVSQDEDETEIQEKIAAVRDLFLKKYQDILEDWDGSIATFEAFNEILDRIVLGPVKISLVGSSGVGKTTLFQLIKGQETPLKHDPTIFVNIGGLKAKVGEYKIPLRIWDFGGQEQFKKAWDRLAQRSDIIVLVLDSTIVNVLKTRKDFVKLMTKTGKDTKVIALANKQDLPKAVKPELIQRVLGVKTYGMVALDPSQRNEVLNIIREAMEEWFKHYGIKIQASRLETEELPEAVPATQPSTQPAVSTNPDTTKS
ncbi:MAG: ADP-ribosylation factor-like protein [Promethearchaeota archaeon]